MGTEKYISEVKLINYPIDKVYGKLSNLKNLETLVDPEKLKQVKDKVPNAPDIKFENFEATEDECSFSIKPIGKVGIRVVERDINKLVKLQGGESLPISFNCWLQLLPVDDANCKLRLTLHAEMNPMIKMMVNKPIKEGVDKIAEALTKIQFE